MSFIIVGIILFLVICFMLYVLAVESELVGIAVVTGMLMLVFGLFVWLGVSHGFKTALIEDEKAVYVLDGTSGHTKLELTDETLDNTYNQLIVK